MNIRRTLFPVALAAVSILVFSVPLLAGHPCPPGSQSIHLTAGDDTTSFGAGAQCVDAMGGNDVVSLGAASDHALGRGGRDRLSGGTDGDVLRGHDGADTIQGEGASDGWLAGHDGTDTVTGGDGNDTVADGAQSDTVRGNAGTGDNLIHCHDGSGDDIAGFEFHTHSADACDPNQ